VISVCDGLFLFVGGGHGIYGRGEGCMNGSADGGREGGFNFGESYGFKALHFENQNRR